MRRFRRLGLRLLPLPVALVVACAAAPATSPPVLIEPGVTVNGLPVGGFTSEEARALVRESFGRPVEFTFGSERWGATPEQLGASAAIDAAIAAALRARPRADVGLGLGVRSAALRRYVKYLDRKFSRDPQNTRLLGLVNLEPALSTPVPGRKLDRARVEAAIRSALASTAREPVALTFKPVPPTVTPDNFGHVIVIRRESNSLYLYYGERLVRSFRVATGTAQYPTPLGTFEIVDMQRNPWWRPPPSDWAKGLKPVPPGPGNPLGTRWMGLSVWGVGIHGTPDAASIGYSASHGCIRMQIPEAEWLFTQVRYGTPVVIVSA